MTSITILTSSPKVPQVKTIVAEDEPPTDRIEASNVKLSVKGATMSKYFSSKEESVDSIYSLTKILEKLQKDPFSFIIRGCVVDGVDTKRHVRRKIKSEKGTIEDVDQQWLCIDLDKKPLAGLGLQPKDVIEDASKVISTLTEDLPVCLKNATCFWHFSSSTGITSEDLISVHLWYWLDQPMSNNDLRTYFSAYNSHIENLFGLPSWVDLVTFDSIQPHFTADPQLVGLKDPIKNRSGILKGKTDVVKISEDWISVTPLDVNERWQEYLMKIGDDQDGFHQPLLSASASWVRKNGYSEKSNKEFIKVAREFISNANHGERSDDEINRYVSDEFLGQLLRTASEKGFDLGGPILTDEASDYFRTHVFVSPLDKFFEKKAGNYIPKGAFNLVGRKFGLGAAGANIFVESGGDIVNKIACLPGEEIGGLLMENGELTYNSWPGRTTQPGDKPKGQMLEDHIYYICGNDDEITNTILNYMCHIIQWPGKKIMWAPVIGSKTQGIGKSIIKELYYNILAPKMITEIGVTDLSTDYNNYMFNTEIIFIEEVYTNNRKSITDKLKTMITEKRVNVNIKNLSAFNTPNTINLFLFTNHENALYIDEADRRFYPTYTRVPPKSASYYAKLVKHFREDAPGIMRWMMDRDLSDFNRATPPAMTIAKKKAVAYSTPEWRSTLKEALEENSWPFQHPVMVASDMLDAIHSIVGKRMAAQYVYSYIKEELGFVRFGSTDDNENGIRVKLRDGTRSYLWICRDKDEITAMNNDQVLELLKPIGNKEEWRSSRSY